MSRRDLTGCQWQEVETAAKRLARSFGCGSGWQAAITQCAEEDAGVDNAPLSIVHRGRVTEQAAWRVDTASRHVRRQHAWARHAGVVAVPNSSPNVESMAALSYACLPGPLYWLLRAYACECIASWYRVEPHLHREVPSPNQTMAGRDAMARIMYRRAGAPQDSRARQVGVRAADYRRETFAAEQLLRHWLVRAATLANRSTVPASPRMGGSQGTGHRTETWWRDGNAPRRRPNE